MTLDKRRIPEDNQAYLASQLRPAGARLLKSKSSYFRGKTRAGTKQATLLALLSRAEGASIDELAEATGWQKHTVRGTMSHTLKKRLGLTIASERNEDRVRRYYIQSWIKLPTDQSG